MSAWVTICRHPGCRAGAVWQCDRCRKAMCPDHSRVVGKQDLCLDCAEPPLRCGAKGGA